jgi:hypothetical protein
MIHRQKHHLDKVNMCRDFVKGICPFKDKICWYNHSETVIGTSMDMTRVKCNLCDETFINKSELMSHRKQNHTNTVPECKNYGQGTCWFGDMKCWFKHENIEKNNKNEDNEELSENKEVIEKLFKMMEIITKRIIILEERI